MTSLIARIAIYLSEVLSLGVWAGWLLSLSFVAERLGLSQVAFVILVFSGDGAATLAVLFLIASRRLTRFPVLASGFVAVALLGVLWQLLYFHSEGADFLFLVASLFANVLLLGLFAFQCRRAASLSF